jgi:hypothetical protein
MPTEGSPTGTSASGSSHGGGGGFLGGLEKGLDVLGWVPGPIGIAANIGSAGISFSRGDFLTGGLLLAGAVVPGGGKLGKLTSNAIGQLGEKALGKLVGGTAQKMFETSIGKRFIDRFVEAERWAHESKVGYKTLTHDTKIQINKEIELIRDKVIRGSTWHFSESPVTGRIGASAPLAEYLENGGIKIK